MVAGEWLCVYDIRINKPMFKESTHAGDATCIDWHPTRKYVIATGGGRDRSVKG
jgi:WD40 repeat protein